MEREISGKEAEYSPSSTWLGAEEEARRHRKSMDAERTEARKSEART